MKVTKRMLRNMIKEELAKMLNEQTTITNRGGKLRTIDSRRNNRARGRAGRHGKDIWAQRAYNILFDENQHPRWRPGRTSAQGLAGTQQADNRDAFVQILHEKTNQPLYRHSKEFNSYLQQLRGRNTRKFDSYGAPVVVEVDMKSAHMHGKEDEGWSGESFMYVIGWEEAIPHVYPNNKTKVLGKIRDVVQTYELPPPAYENKNKPQNQIILENHRRGRQSHPVTRKEWWNEEV